MVGKRSLGELPGEPTMVSTNRSYGAAELVGIHVGNYEAFIFESRYAE